MLCTSRTFDTFGKYELSLWYAQWKYASFLPHVISQNWFDAPFCFPEIFPNLSYVCDLHNDVFKRTF